VLNRTYDQTGVTLIELLVVIGMLIVVLSATFAAFNSFGNAASINFAQNQAQSAARTAVDRMARELRNTSSPGLPNAPVERAQSYDLVFQTVDPTGAGGGSNSRSVERVRYCLDSSSDLWKQVQTWTTATPPSLPAASGCPDSSYGTQARIVEYVVNKANGQNRPAFTYDGSTAAQVTEVTVELYTDTSLTRPPGAQRLSTTIFLRNENRSPTATFTATLTGNKHVLLNASASADPDGDDLTYIWYDGSTQIGTGVLFDYAAGTTGNHTLSVQVTDPAGLSTTSATQTVNVT
jgi:type II secretory pathway pseudopilin PulG